MQNGMKFQRRQENIGMTCPTTTTSEPSNTHVTSLSPQRNVNPIVHIRQANISLNLNDDTRQDTSQHTGEDQETIETHIENDASEDECPYCDESGCSVYDCELCLVCNGTHRLQNILLYTEDIVETT